MTAERILDGGPAFPVSTNSKGDDEHGPYGHQDSTQTWQFPGMTLRDYFAAKALVGICAMVAAGKHESRDFTARPPEEKLALDAYLLADAMLKAREA